MPQLSFPPARVPIGQFTDSTGRTYDVLMTPEFARSLTTLLARVGGPAGMSNDDLYLLAQFDNSPATANQTDDLTAWFATVPVPATAGDPALEAAPDAALAMLASEVRNLRRQLAMMTEHAALGGELLKVLNDIGVRIEMLPNYGPALTALGTMSKQNANAVAITGGTSANVVTTGGTIDNTPVGATTQAAGNFTTLFASGNVRFNNASVIGQGKVSLSYNGTTNQGLNISDSASQSGSHFMEFYKAGTLIGSISNNANTGVAFNTSSDYRLKENVAPMTGGLSFVMQLKPRTYTWRADGSYGEGFIAHELAEVCPAAVAGEKDGMRTAEVHDEEGVVIRTEEQPAYQGIDVSFLVPRLVNAVQELKRDFDEYVRLHP